MIAAEGTGSGVAARRGARRVPMIVLAALLLLFSAADDLRILPGDAALATDYNDFYVAATAQRQGHNAYDEAVLDGILRSTFGKSSFSNTVASPPAFFVAFRPFTLLPPRPGYLIWLALSCLALWSAVRALVGMLGQRGPWIWLLALSPPSTIALFLGQISLFVLAAYVWAIRLLLAGRPRWAGVLLALTLVKPHLMLVPAALLCGLCWRRGGRVAAASASGSVVLLCLLALPFGEPGAFGHWVGALFTYGGSFDRWQPDLSSLAGIYLPLVPRTVGRALSVLALLAGLGCAAWLLRGAARHGVAPGEPAWWRRLALGTAIWLAVLPYIHPYDDTLLLVPLAVLLAGASGREPRDWTLIACMAMIGLPQLDLMGFRPNLTFSYTSVAVLAAVAALQWRGQAHLTVAPEAMTGGDNLEAGIVIKDHALADTAADAEV